MDMKTIDGKVMYSRKELAIMLGVTPTTIANKQKSGILPSVRIGRGYYTSEIALAKFLDGDTSVKD